MSAAGTGAARAAREYAGALVAAAVAMMALGALFLAPYLLHAYRLPVQWDSPAYVSRTNLALVSGLDRIGTIRAATPLLLAVMGRATGQNSLTMVSIVPAVVAGVIGLAAAAMLRSAFGIRPVWVPVMAVLVWITFGHITMLDGHIDNAVNAAFAVAAVAASVAAARGRRGAPAVALLFVAAGLAEWPFFVFAMVVFLLGLGLYAVLVLRGTEVPRADVGVIKRLFAAAVVSTGGVLLLFLGVPASGGGLGIHTHRGALRARFVGQLQSAWSYFSVPLAAVGAVAAVRIGGPEARRPERRLFLCLMASWVVVTLLAAGAQLLGVPSAGARLLSFFFALHILAALGVWAIAGWLGANVRPRGLGVALAAGAAVIVVAAFGLYTARDVSHQHPWMEQAAVQQTATAGAYVRAYAPGRDVVYTLAASRGRDRTALFRWWQVVRASLPPEQIARAYPYFGSPESLLDYLARGAASGVTNPPHNGSLRPADPVVVVLQRYDRPGYVAAAQRLPNKVVGPGVVVYRGPASNTPLRAASAPSAATSRRSLAMIGFALTALLLVAGGGWSRALLPGDPVVRVALAPALGAATIVLAALAWDRIGLGFQGAEALGPLILAAGVGWALGAAAIVKRRRGAGGIPYAEPDPDPGPAAPGRAVRVSGP